MEEEGSPEPEAPRQESEKAGRWVFLALRSSPQAQRNAKTKRAERPLFSRRGRELTGIDSAQHTGRFCRWRDNQLHGCNEARAGLPAALKSTFLIFSVHLSADISEEKAEMINCKIIALRSPHFNMQRDAHLHSSSRDAALPSPKTTAPQQLAALWKQSHYCWLIIRW